MGVDVIELGVPFSDPIMMVLGFSARVERAVAQGVGVRDVLTRNLYAQHRHARGTDGLCQSD